MDANQSAQNAYYLSQIQQNIQESVDAAAEAQRRRQEIGYTINNYPQQTTSQPK